MASTHDLGSIKSCIKLMWPPRLEFSWDGLHHNNSKQKHSTSTFILQDAMHAYLHAKHVIRAINFTLKSPRFRQGILNQRYLRFFWPAYSSSVRKRCYCPLKTFLGQLMPRAYFSFPASLALLYHRGLQRHSAKEKIYLSF